MSFSRKTLIAVCVLATISSISLKASADSGDTICSNSLNAVCVNTLDQRKERNEYSLKLKKEIYQEATVKAKVRIDELLRTTSKIHFIKRYLGKIRIFNQEIMNSARKRISGIETVVTNQDNIKKIKNYMYQSIDTSNFDTATKEKFKAVIKTVVVGNFNDFIQKMDLENNVVLQVLANACGSDGLVENAFATELNKERYVLICPGFLITLNQQASDAERFNTILQAITHEMGHHLDNRKFGKDLYAPYLNCLAKNYSNEFNKTKADERFCKKNAKEPKKCNQQVVLSHAGELIADQWGIRATVIHAQSEAYSTSDADLMLVSSWANLCGSADEGIHPTGDFRIETLMRKNPGITQYLSCLKSETNAKPACSFAGETAI